VGAKLHILLEEGPRMIARVNGASTSEEIATVLNRLVEQIVVLERQHGALRISSRYQAGEDHPVTRSVLPPFRDLDEVASQFSIERVLNVTPAQFFLELSDQYLLAALNQILYASMMTENSYRVRYLDGAVRHIDGQTGERARQSNALRQ
jgi:F-type H+-transporting ATPase subunit gamma